MDPRTGVVDLVAGLSARDRAILTDRLAAEAPKTLDELGQEFGVTRERVRQLETALKARLRAFPWSPVMDGVVPVHGQWIRHVEQVQASVPGYAWFQPLGADGPTTMELLLAAEQFELVKGQWLARRMGSSGAAPGRWLQLVQAGAAGTILEAEYIADLGALGLTPPYALRWIEGNGLAIRHGIVCSAYEHLDAFLVTEFTAAGGAVDVGTIGQWIEGRWALRSAMNLLQSDPRFARVDVERYALSSLGLPEYRGIREAIRDLISERGPMALVDVVAAVSGAFDVEPSSVEHYALERPFRVKGGIVDFRGARSSSSSASSAQLALADLPEGRQWRHIFLTPTGYACRITVNAEHLRGSGYLTSIALARIVGLRQGEVWERELENVEAPLKISRAKQSQPAVGSIKKALDAQEARVGDIAFIRFHGSEADIESVSLVVVHSDTVTRDPFSQALALVGRAADVEDPFEAICEALGVDADFASELVEVATRRKDEQLAAALAEIAAM